MTKDKHKDPEQEQTADDDKKIKVTFPDGTTVEGRAILGALISEGKSQVEEENLSEQDCPHESSDECDCEQVDECPYGVTGANIMLAGKFSPKEIMASMEGIEEAMKKYMTTKVFEDLDSEKMFEMAMAEFFEYMKSEVDKEEATGDDIREFMDEFMH